MTEAHLSLTIGRRELIREKVYEHLRNEILSNRLGPGTRMVESRLAADIGASRTPIREALHLLEMEGLVESMPRVGYRVRDISWGEVEEIVEIRFVNESLALRWALKRITEEEIAALEANTSSAGAAIEDGHPEKSVEYDAEFHDILVRASGSARLQELCQTLRRHMIRYRIGSLDRPEVGREALAGHLRILDRIKARDYQGAKKALRLHLDISKEAIRRHTFENQPEPR